jgi:hypothetical protein
VRLLKSIAILDDIQHDLVGYPSTVDHPDTTIAEAPDTAERHGQRDMAVMESARDVLSPREVADRAGFSYHAILRAIHRGDLQAFEPVPGHYRIEVAEYKRWLRRPARPRQPPPTPAPRRERPRPAVDSSHPGSFARLRAIEGS